MALAISHRGFLVANSEERLLSGQRYRCTRCTPGALNRQLPQQNRDCHNVVMRLGGCSAKRSGSLTSMLPQSLRRSGAVRSVRGHDLERRQCRRAISLHSEDCLPRRDRSGNRPAAQGPRCWQCTCARSCGGHWRIRQQGVQQSLEITKVLHWFALQANWLVDVGLDFFASPMAIAAARAERSGQSILA